MKKIKLSDLLDSWSAGAWGEPAIDQTKAVSVLRSTNFINSGELSLKNLALLDIPKGVYEKKQLYPNDILLERSGGGEKNSQLAGWLSSESKVDLFAEILFPA